MTAIFDCIVNRIFAFEGDGIISQYEGGFTDYQVEYLKGTWMIRNQVKRKQTAKTAPENMA